MMFSQRTRNHLREAIDTLGPERTLELLADVFIDLTLIPNMSPAFKRAYGEAVADLAKLVTRFENARREAAQ